MFFFKKTYAYVDADRRVRARACISHQFVDENDVVTLSDSKLAGVRGKGDGSHDVVPGGFFVAGFGGEFVPVR